MKLLFNVIMQLTLEIKNMYKNAGAILDAVCFQGVPIRSISLSPSLLMDSNTF